MTLHLEINCDKLSDPAEIIPLFEEHSLKIVDALKHYKFNQRRVIMSLQRGRNVVGFWTLKEPKMF
ncbi:MAG: hypothetical protein ACMUJM_25255 [bacterium]